MFTRNSKLASLLLFGFSWLLCAPALAHKPSDSYIKITGGEEYLTATWDIALIDLDFLIGLDADLSGDLTWGELKAQRNTITAHALSHLRMSADGKDCELEVTDLLVTQHSDGCYAVLVIKTSCPGDVAVINLQYNLLFDADPTHRGLVLYSNGAVSSTHVLSPNAKSLELQTGEASLWNSFKAYVVEGVWHIWIGYDHILFLLSLLLPAVFIRREKNWQPVESFAPAGKTVLKIVTVFTLAHSITLWIAVMEYVTLPAQLVEATIAFSIIITALNNLYPVLPLTGWAIAFIFGLVHGFGFANVLLDLGLSNVTLALSLLGFNVGVELGQLAIVLLFLPLAYTLRTTNVYRQVIFRFGSVLIAVVAVIWMIERVLKVEILGL